MYSSEQKSSAIPTFRTPWAVEQPTRICSIVFVWVTVARFTLYDYYMMFLEFPPWERLGWYNVFMHCIVAHTNMYCVACIIKTIPHSETTSQKQRLRNRGLEQSYWKGSWCSVGYKLGETILQIDQRPHTAGTDIIPSSWISVNLAPIFYKKN